MAQSKGRFTVEEWLELLRICDHRCQCCGRRAAVFEADHVVPLCCGGSSYIVNIQPLCRGCNAKKYKQTIDYRSPEVRAKLVEMVLTAKPPF